MNPARVLKTAMAVLDIDEQRAAFDAALEKLPPVDRLAMELLLSDNGPMKGLGLGRVNKLELLGKVASFAAVHKLEHWANGNGPITATEESE